MLPHVTVSHFKLVPLLLMLLLLILHAVPAGVILYGFNVGALQSFSRSAFGAMIPEGLEANFYSLWVAACDDMTNSQHKKWPMSASMCLVLCQIASRCSRRTPALQASSPPHRRHTRAHPSPAGTM